MSHPSDGALRLYLDDPEAVPEWVRRHEAACSGCQTRLQAISGDATFAATHLASIPAPANLDRAWGRLHASLPVQRRPSLIARLADRWRVSAPMGRAPVAVAVGALLVVVLAVTAFANQNFLPIFQPKQVQPITLTSQELQGLPNLSQYGTMTHGPKIQPHSVPSLAAAEQASGLQAAHAGWLPSGLPEPSTYYVSSPSWASFTFSTAKAEAAAARAHQPAPSIPADLNGSSIVVSFGSALAQAWGNVDQPGQGEALGIVQMRSPKVSSSGVTARQLENYLLNQPGVSPSLKAAIREIGDPTSTLPIPVLTGQMSGTSVKVQGVNGVLVGDNTGLGAGVIWVKHGVVYGVAGTFTQAQVLRIANSLS